MLLKLIYKKEKTIIWLNIFGIIMFTVLKLLKSPLVGFTIDRLVNIEQNSFYILIAINLLYFLLFSSARIVQSRLEERTETMLKESLNNIVHEKLLSLNINKFNNNYDVSSVTTLYLNELPLLLQNFIMIRFELFYLIFSFLTGIIYLFTINYLFIIFILLSTVVSLYLTPRLRRSISLKQKKYNFSIELFIKKLEEDIKNLFTIKKNSKEDVFYSSFKKENKELMKKKLDVGYDKQKMINISDLVGIFIIVGCNILGAYLVLKKKILIGDVVAVNLVIPFLTNPIFSYTKMLNSLSIAESVAKKINSLLEIKENRNLNELSEQIHTIEFNNVSYGYKDTILVKDFSFIFEKGKKYLFLGKSGVGKSSFFYLLSKLKEDFQGEILINNEDIKKISSSSYYNRISIVEQKGKIFEYNLKNNIVFFRVYHQDIFDSILEECDLIDLNDSQGENCLYEKKISGGQLQRIHLGRELYKKSSVVILDEAFSSLDSFTSKKIEYKLLKKDIMLINISHRIDSDNLKLYNNIIYFNGKNIEILTPESYIKTKK